MSFGRNSLYYKSVQKKFEQMIAYTNEDERWGKKFVPYSLRHLYATLRLQHGTTRSAHA